MQLGYTYDPTTDSYAADAAPTADQAASLNAIAPNTTQVIADQQQPGESWAQTLTRSLPAIAATYQQKQLLDVQAQRAKAGLPPLDMSQYSTGVNVGLSPATTNMLLLGVAAIVGVVLLTKH